MLGACQSSSTPARGEGVQGEKVVAGKRAPVRRDAAPAYAEVAKSYNLRVERLDRLFARANLRVTYFDAEGEQKTEQPEGRLQIIRPDRLALSLGKAGQTLFWFGCDASRYWWLDMSERSKSLAAVGSHEKFDATTARRIGIAIRPLDLIRVLAITPLDPALPGATQWSDDGTQIGVTTPIGRRGVQRVWINPTTFLPKTVEVFDEKRQLVLIADHEDVESVEQTRGGVVTPQVSARVNVFHIESQTEARITITGARDGPISDKAFDLKTLMEKYEIERTIDLDAPPAQKAKLSQ